MSWLGPALALFVGTNIDDLVLLSLFFAGSADQPGATRRIVLGQYAGFAVILGVALVGAAGAGQLPRPGIALLGLVPIALGLFAAGQAWGSRGGPGSRPGSAPARATVRVVALVTMANGADNVAAYVPALAGRPVDRLAAVAGLFLALLGGWCYLGYRLANHRLAVAVMRRWGHVIYPLVLITIGLVVVIGQW